MKTSEATFINRLSGTELQRMRESVQLMLNLYDANRGQAKLEKVADTRADELIKRLKWSR